GSGYGPRPHALEPFLALLWRPHALIAAFQEGGDAFGEIVSRRPAIAVSAAVGLLDDFIDDAQGSQVVGRDAHGGRGNFLLVDIAPEDFGTAFGWADHVDGMFQHGDDIADSDAQCPATTAFADDDAIDGGTQGR